MLSERLALASGEEDGQAKRFTIRVFVLAVAIAALSLVHFIANLGVEMGRVCLEEFTHRFC